MLDINIERLEKGKSLIEFLNSYIVIDLETTGLDPTWDEIIEVAAIRIENNVIIDTFHSFVKPTFEIDEFITELTGINNNMLSDAPNPLEILPKFLTFLADYTIVAHNANFDINFLYDFTQHNSLPAFSNNFIDTMRLSRRMFKDEKHHRLFDLVNRFGIDTIVEHRALSDAQNTYKCYEYMKTYAKNNNINLLSLYPSKGLSAKEITSQVNTFDKHSPIFDKVFVFTGTLERMSRREAMQLVVDLGGKCSDGINKKTNYLVLGNNDYCSQIKDGKSNKQKKAEKLQLLGNDIITISETIFYEMILDSDL